MARVLVSNIMMLKERERFDRILRDRDVEPVWADVSQFLDEEACLGCVGEVEGWLAGDDRITRKVLAKAVPALKVISKWGTGIDSIDLAAAKEFGVPVCNAPGAFSDAVSEVAFGYVVMLARKLGSTDRAVRRGEWPKSQTRELTGSTLGLIGFGAIGKGIAQRASGFRMKIVFHDPFFRDLYEGPGWTASPVALDALAAESDVICLACNLTADNFHVVDGRFLAKMKPSAFLVNVGRGPLVDEAALLDALKSGAIAGAGLDVYEQEPPEEGHALFGMENVVLGSHNANNGVLAVEHVHEVTLANLFKHLAG